MAVHKKYMVLNYHALSVNSTDNFTVHPEIFRSHMQLIHERKFPFVEPGEKISDHEPTGVMITFDDGHASDYQVAFPVLSEFGFTAMFFPYVSAIGQKGKITSRQLLELVNAGHAVGSHGLTHRELTSLDRRQQADEIVFSKHRLQELTGNEITCFAFPYGSCNNDVVELAGKAGYRNAMTTRAIMNDGAGNSFLVHRWNIRKTTSLDTIEAALSGFGELPLDRRLKSTVRYYTRKIIGTDSVNRIREYLKTSKNG